MVRKKASDFPQELLNLFDRYVHGGIDRPQSNFMVPKSLLSAACMDSALLKMLLSNDARAIQVQKKTGQAPKSKRSPKPGLSPRGRGFIAVWNMGALSGCVPGK